MSETRSPELALAGYFLSRLTRSDGRPPVLLSVTSWGQAYQMFYESCGGGRTPEEFHNTMKGTRDHFDAHLPNNRTGFLQRDGSGLPRPLGETEARVFDEWQERSDSELEEAIRDLL